MEEERNHFILQTFFLPDNINILSLRKVCIIYGIVLKLGLALVQSNVI